MTIDVTLKGKDFDTVHNALCEMDNLVSTLFDIGHASESKSLEKIMKTIRKGLKGAYAQDDAHMTNSDDQFDAIKKQFNYKSIWSIHEVDLLDRHTFKQNNLTKLKYQDITVDIDSNIHRTWCDLYAAAERAIIKSGDEHYIYIEGFAVNPDDSSELILSTAAKQQ
jgi:hypothetical protein